MALYGVLHVCRFLLGCLDFIGILLGMCFVAMWVVCIMLVLYVVGCVVSCGVGELV